ncbi:hypothetical protein BDDG_01267 [Blastomyces dermatitidis ATCC 18188]|uniref:Uncharacterized protein n=1 Tax=Ajellomyces dermatitidis (strain ATCC 18188 / CBS 674.68) TaxID=653446 RepID=F2T5A5_AJEDA|nr:hypothetical protein BDDG_01267 [Blastomyces dermatitidis ATCC 18188]
MEMSFRSTTLGIRICAIKTGAIGLIATIAELRNDGLGLGKSGKPVNQRSRQYTYHGFALG